jgi:hypothetical protein
VVMVMTTMMIQVAFLAQQVTSYKPLVPKVCSTDPKGSANSSQVSVYTFQELQLQSLLIFLIKGITVC